MAKIIIEIDIDTGPIANPLIPKLIQGALRKQLKPLLKNPLIKKVTSRVEP